MTITDTASGHAGTRRTSKRTVQPKSRTRDPAASSAPRSAEPQREEMPIGQTAVPVELADIHAKAGADVYAMVCTGDCLEPVIHNRAVVLVSPGMPIRPGDYVVLWPKDQAHQSGVKRVVMAPPADWATWSPDSEVVPLVIVEQFNPPRQYRITTDKLSAIHRVFATFTPGKPEWAVFDEPAPSKRQAAGRAAMSDTTTTSPAEAVLDPVPESLAAAEKEIAELETRSDQLSAAGDQATIPKSGTAFSRSASGLR